MDPSFKLFPNNKYITLIIVLFDQNSQKSTEVPSFYAAYHAIFREFCNYIPANHSFPPFFRIFFSPYSQLFMHHSEANFKAIDTGAAKKTRQTGAKNQKQRNEIARLGYDGIPMQKLSRREVFDFFARHSTPDREDRSLLFAIVSTGHCIRVEGSRS